MIQLKAFERAIKPWVVGILVKEISPGDFRVMTQLRYVSWRPYDPINHNCWEAVAGLLNEGEDCISCLLRELREECGVPDNFLPIRIAGVREEDLHNEDRQVLALTSEEDFTQALATFTRGTPPDGKEWSTSKGDRTLRYQPPRIPTDENVGYRPLCVVWNQGKPQQWLGPVFVVMVGYDFEPYYEAADGEAGPCVWWTPYQLLRVMAERPDIFMGPLIPAYELLCVELLAGKLDK